jgi:photosystem II stability/assembly factor-like uncharacterized protein
VVASPTDPQRLYAASNYGGVYRSTDGGASFTLVGLSGETVRDLLCHPADGNILWAATYAGVFYSTDGGGTWQQRSAGLQVVRVNNLEMDPQDPAVLYCGTYLGYAYKSTDGGQNWSLVNQGLGADIIFDIDVSPFDSDLVIAGGIETKGVWRSTDGGATWSSASTGLINKSVWSVEFDPHDPDRVFAGTQGGVAVSYDGGLTWQDFSTGLVISDIRDVKVDPSDPATVFVASYGGGLFVHTEGVTDAPRVAPVAALLRPNYPNPFNPSTTLAFEIEGEAPAPVRLEVYDLRGRRVAGLVDERLAPGLYRRTWNALDGTGARVASGSYLAVLRVDGAVAGTRKMTLVQ